MNLSKSISAIFHFDFLKFLRLFLLSCKLSSKEVQNGEKKTVEQGPICVVSECCLNQVYEKT